MSSKLPVNIQLFAEPAQEQQTTSDASQQNNQQAMQTNVDYDKIQKMLDGTLQAKTDTALKAYFKQQGLSQEEAEQAIADFKAQKAAQQPDVSAMQQQLEAAQQAVQQEKLEKIATMQALQMGVDVKTVPYLIRMADLTAAINSTGEIDAEQVVAGLNKVLEDVPNLKPQTAKTEGFVQVGTAANETNTNNNDKLADIFGNKKG